MISLLYQFLPTWTLHPNRSIEREIIHSIRRSRQATRKHFYFQAEFLEQ